MCAAAQNMAGVDLSPPQVHPKVHPRNQRTFKRVMRRAITQVVHCDPRTLVSLHPKLSRRVAVLGWSWVDLGWTGVDLIFLRSTPRNTVYPISILLFFIWYEYEMIR